MHHFRSSSLESEKIYLKEKWDECLVQSNFTLPIRRVKVYDSDGDQESEEYYRVFLSEPWPMAEGSQKEQSECSAKSQNEDNLPFEYHTANGQEEEQSQPLICTTLTGTLSVDEAELSDDESNECTENIVNSPNDRVSILLMLYKIHLMLTATSNWSQSTLQIKKIWEINMNVILRCYELNLLSQYLKY